MFLCPAAPGSGGFDAGHVGAAAGLADCEAGDHVARNGRGEVGPLQLLAAEVDEGGRGAVGVHSDGHGRARTPRMAQGLDKGDIVLRIYS